MTTYGSMEDALRFAEAQHHIYTDLRYASHNPCTTIYRLVSQLLGKDVSLNKEVASKVDGCL